MGCVPVQIPAIRRCGVYHENSETLFSVTFDQDMELAAAIFAEIYDRASHDDRARYITETYQVDLGNSIVLFLKAYGLHDEQCWVSPAWAQALDDYDEDALNDGYTPEFQVQDLVNVFAGGYSSPAQRRRAAEKISWVLDQFKAWKVLA